jgi:hypothetical protein
MIRSLYLAVIFSTVFIGAAMGAELYKPEEFFPEPYLGLLRMINSKSETEVRGFIDKNGIDLNKEFRVPWAVDLKKAYEMSRFQRWKADKIFVPAPSFSGYAPETITLLNFLIINDALEALKKLLTLGADPETNTHWYGNGYNFAVRFNRVGAFDLLLDAKPFSVIKSENRYFIDGLFTTKTVKHWFSEDDYVLKFPELLEVAYKHKIDFNDEFGSFREYPILDLSLNGLEKVIWLIKHGADISVISETGDSLPLGVETWLASETKRSEKSKLRIKKLLIIKQLLVERGVAFPPPTQGENLAKRRAQGKRVIEIKKTDQRD